MLCLECFEEKTYDKTTQDKHCTNCGRPMQPDVRDILEHGMYDLAKEHRPAQIEMAVTIEKLLKSKSGILMAEGGCGIGKSFAYLIPALLQMGKRVVVSTGKTNLQDQLIDTDLPTLQRAMGPRGTWGIYKGRGNYGCRMRVNAAPKNVQPQYEQFLADVGKHPADKKLWPGKNPTWWGMVNADDCPLEKCDHMYYCTTKPRDMQLVVANHSLVGIDLANGPGKILGHYDVLIIDEAHTAVEIFREAFTSKLNFRRLDTARKTFINDKAGLHQYMRHVTEEKKADLPNPTICAAELSDMCSAYKALLAEARKVTSTNGTVRMAKLGAEVVDLLVITESIASKIDLIDDHLKKVLGGYAAAKKKEATNALIEGRPEKPVVANATEGRMIRYRDQTKRMLSTFKSIIRFCVEVELEGHGSQLVTLAEEGFNAMPIDMGETLRHPMSQIPYKVITSATLVHDGTFNRAMDDLGLPPENTITAVYESPFDMNKQARLYLPTHIPYPIWSGHANKAGRARWISILTQEILQLIDCTHGDAFVLFGSRIDMEAVIAEIGPDWWGDKGINLCAQGAVASHAYQKFMAKDHSVIFGLKSFWEGIDIPGDKLKLVALAKLPLMPHVGALVEALMAKAVAEGKDGYSEVVVPGMINDVRQGLGRLIRSATDRGILAILDPKIHTAATSHHIHTQQMTKHLNKIKTNPLWTPPGYARVLLNALGFKEKVYDIKEIDKQVREWFNLARLNLR